MKAIGDVILSFAVSGLLLGCYMMPTIIALLRHIHGVGQVIVVNLAFGWTIVGWIVALAMSFRAVPAPQTAPLPPSWPQSPALSNSEPRELDLRELDPRD